MRFDLDEDGLGCGGLLEPPAPQKAPVIRRPELLAHPNIPKPLHGVAPRVVMGRKWWDEKRQEAYAKGGYRCWACGVHKDDALIRNWLEAHESYSIDYEKGIVELHEIVALCHACHSFIHSGRLWALLKSGEITESRFEMIVSHGLRVLREAGIKPWWGTMMNILQFEQRLPDWGALDQVEIPEEELIVAAWDEWRLVIDGKSFGPKHESFADWKEHYGELESEVNWSPERRVAASGDGLGL